MRVGKVELLSPIEYSISPNKRRLLFMICGLRKGHDPLIRSSSNQGDDDDDLFFDLFIWGQVDKLTKLFRIILT